MALMFFNNMVVLSRAFWVPDGHDRDVIPAYRSPERTQNCVSEARSNSRVERVGVSPEELSRTSVG